jgi:NADPH:quinone reductase-like Zn-dependent oxidoreductase
MLALIASPGARGNVELREVPEPQPFSGQALVRVEAFSLNRGETRRLADMEEGQLTGWDVAGVVEQAAADGSGPKAGTRVVGVSQNRGWAQLAAIDTKVLAVLPDEVSAAQAATLPVAGLTALKALDIIGPVLARRVLVTGASGGVGRLAVQLAKMAGAHVTGVSANPERARGVLELGADEVIAELEPEGPEFDGIVEGVGGASLAAAIQRVASFGTIVSFASSDPSPVEFPARSFFGRAPGARLHGFYLFGVLAREPTGTRDLGRLVELVEQGRLACSIEHQASWREAAEAIEALLDRRIAGKAVLLVD